MPGSIFRVSRADRYREAPHREGGAFIFGFEHRS
jgi:hypothetical protein